MGRGGGEEFERVVYLRLSHGTCRSEGIIGIRIIRFDHTRFEYLSSRAGHLAIFFRIF